jgi:predicted nucleotidyltransferase component of viral defense system
LVVAGNLLSKQFEKYAYPKGGNNFRKCYFEHFRFSRDLDFAATSPLDLKATIDELNGVCEHIEDLTDVDFYIEKNKIENKRNFDEDRPIYEARIYFKDFYGVKSRVTISIKLDISQFEKIHLPIQSRPLIHPYSDSDKCITNINCVKLEESVAAKLKCIMQRKHIADFFDFIYSCRDSNLQIDKMEVLKVFLQKTIFEPSPGMARNILLNLPLELMSEAWKRYIIMPLTARVSFDDALQSFKSLVLEIFGAFPNPPPTSIFFPVGMRQTIIDAGNEQKLLQLSYDGVQRSVEPYSLAFKVKKTGFAREYFYAFYQTGGRTSPPGIKIFLHEKIQNLQKMADSFSRDLKWSYQKQVNLVRNLIFRAVEALGDDSRLELGGNGAARDIVRVELAEEGPG